MKIEKREEGVGKRVEWRGGEERVGVGEGKGVVREGWANVQLGYDS